MIKLTRDYSFVDGANYRYVNALMIEARFRGYDGWWHDGSLAYIGHEKFIGFKQHIDKIITWLLISFPDEFEED